MPETKRRSAAIMFAEMLGYEELRDDESLAKHLLEKERSLILQASSNCGGRDFGGNLAVREDTGLRIWLAGTGVKSRDAKLHVSDSLVLFESSLDALRCAVEIHSALREYNRQAPSKKDIYVKIGIHFGEVAEGKGEAAGEAVAVASRIAPLAPPGAVCVSQQVYEQVKNQVDFEFERLPQMELKDVSSPMDVYLINLEKGQRQYAKQPEPLDKHRVAVLPLANFSQDENDEYFSDGMTEELISALANVSGLQVISRTSVMQYKKTTKKIVEIGRDLAAGSIIEGSVRRSGNQLRIAVQLIDTMEDKHLWSQSYDRELKDVFVVQSDIATNVSEVLKVRLLQRESVELLKPATNSMEAYTEYLKGRFQWNKRTKEGVEKAIEHFHSAINRDPNYPLAYAGLADCYNVAADWGYMSWKDAYSRAKQASLKALQLDTNLAEAHASLGWMLWHSEWNWLAAEAEFKRALQLNPNYGSAWLWNSILLACLGRPDEALVEAKKAAQMDPLSPRIASNVGERLCDLGEYDLAVDQFKKALELQQDFVYSHSGLAFVYAKKSMLTEALSECQIIDSLPHSDLEGKLVRAYVCALCGRKDEARRILESTVGSLESESISLPLAVEVYSVLEEKNSAIELLWRGYESHNPRLIFINRLDLSDLIRSDQRFIELEKKIGLRK